jgi:hypothetical protein
MNTPHDTPHDTEPARLDGNTLGGPLAELFTTDLTAAIVTCAHCGNTAPLAAHHLYPDAPALVLRCPACTRVVLRYTSDTHGLRFEMTGIRLLTMTTPGDPEP